MWGWKTWQILSFNRARFRNAVVPVAFRRARQWRKVTRALKPEPTFGPRVPARNEQNEGETPCQPNRALSKKPPARRWPQSGASAKQARSKVHRSMYETMSERELYEMASTRRKGKPEHGSSSTEEE
jgi:Protein of unknwon function (DUF3008)